MAKIKWDQTGEKLFETGVKNGVLYPISSEGKYDMGYAWNGLSAVTESPSGAEPTAIWADDIKYLNLISAEELGLTIEAYMYPDEFAECDGSAALKKGVYAGQQKRKVFGFAYRTTLGNDVDGNDYGYKLHLVYGCTASPSEKNYQTINDSPEAISFSWEVATVPVDAPGIKPTACLTINSKEVPKEFLAELEGALYGTAEKEPYLPLPEEVATMYAKYENTATAASTTPEIAG